MHKLTNSDIQVIQQLAASLPRVERSIVRRMTGAELIELGIHQHNGAPVIPEGSYRVQVIKVANLVKVLQDLAREQGTDTIHHVVEHLKEGRPVLTKYGAIRIAPQATA